MLAPAMEGRRFGSLVVRERDGVDESGHHMRWLCECDCTKTARRTTSILISGRSRSCGCRKQQRNIPRIEMVGRTFGRLTVKQFDRRGKSREFMWLCECECKTTKVINGSTLRSGATRSCGCLHKEGGIRTPAEHRGKVPTSKLKPGSTRKATPEQIKYRESGRDSGYYRVNSGAHERALATLGISFA